MASARARPLAVFALPMYRLYAVNRLLAFLNVTLLTACIGWHIYELTGSAVQIAMVGVVRFVPSLFLSLVGGSVADALDRRRIVMAAMLVPLAGAAVLAASTFAGFEEPWLLLVVSASLSAGTAFEFPARQALLPQVVPLPLFTSAVTANSVMHQVGFVTGPVVAGGLIAGPGIAYAYGAAALVVLAGIAAFVPLRPGPRTFRSPVSLAAIREGVAFVFRRQVLLGAMTLDLFAVVFGGAAALLPIYANDILGVGARGYGVLTASAEVGALLTGALLIFLPPIRSAGRALLVAVSFYGVATIAFGLSRSFGPSLFAFALTGVADEISVVMRHTTVQLAAPDALRGRVNSVNQVFIGASNQLAVVESGFVAAAFTPTFAVVSGGVGTILVVVLVALLMPGLRGYRIGDEDVAAEVDARESVVASLSGESLVERGDVIRTSGR